MFILLTVQLPLCAGSFQELFIKENNNGAANTKNSPFIRSSHPSSFPLSWKDQEDVEVLGDAFSFRAVLCRF